MKKIVFIIRKELLESVRDTRTFLMVVIMPLFLYPILFMTMGYFTQMEKTREEEIVYKVGIVSPYSDSDFINHIKKSKKIKIIMGDDPERMLKNEKVKAVIEIKTIERIKEYTIHYDGADKESQNAVKRVEKIIAGYKKELVKKELIDQGLSEKILEPFTVSKHNIATAKRMGGFLLGTLIPYLLIIISFSGALHASSDIVAGEKERRTIETLLVTDVKRGELVLGKVSTVFIISLLTAISGLLGLIVTFYSGFSIMSSGGIASLSIPWFSCLLMLIVMCPLIWLFSSLLLSIGVIAKNIKEANTYGTYLLFLVVMIAVFSIMRLTSPGWKLFFIPVLNTAILQQQILVGQFDILNFCRTISSSILYAIIIFLLAKSIFEKEEILYRS